MAKRNGTWTREEIGQLLMQQTVYERLLQDALASLKHPLRQVHTANSSQRAPVDRIRGLHGVRAWVLDNHDLGPFSFHRCCAVLGLDAEAVRDRLRREGYLQDPELRIASAVRTLTKGRLQRAA